MKIVVSNTEECTKIEVTDPEGNVLSSTEVPGDNQVAVVLPDATPATPIEVGEPTAIEEASSEAEEPSGETE